MILKFYVRHLLTVIISLAISSLWLNVSAQDHRLAGRVTNLEGEALANVSVVVKGALVSTSTGIDGSYSISVPTKTGVLVFSSIGYVTQEITFEDTGSYDIVLEPDNRSLDEVVVVGYGTQKKSQLTGAISSVSSAEIGAVPVVSAGQALQGRSAGVDVVASGHSPGSGVTIRIRGINSISANNDPLFVVDGIPISGGLNDINTADIESMEVLKDASATAIYGARGSNGVVLVTTKRGKAGKSQVTYNAYAGIAQLLNKVEVQDAEGWVNYRKASQRTDDINLVLDPIELENYQAGTVVDWQDLVLRNGMQQSHTLGLSGGSESTRFAISSAYLQQDGIVAPSGFKRGSLQFNLDHQPNKRLQVGASLFLSHSKQDIVNTGTILGQAMRISPLGDIYDADGNLTLFPTSEALLGNPLNDVSNDINQSLQTRLFGSLFAEYELAKGLTYRLNFGPDLRFSNAGRFIGSKTNVKQGGLNEASTTKTAVSAYTLENILTFNKRFYEKHALDLTVMQSIQYQGEESSFVAAEGIPAENMRWHDLSAGQNIGFDSDQVEWSIVSYMARANYGLSDRYLLTLTTRIDGSSRFGQNRKYGFFPSAALAWRIADEPFMDRFSALDDLKIRISYGSIGNTAINPYQSLGALVRNGYLFGSEPAMGFQPSTLPNPGLQWETSYQANVGIDFALWRNRLSGSIEVYQIDTKDLLLYQGIPNSTGYSSVLSNIGATRNNGYELTLSTVNLDTEGDFRWSTDLNVAINKNKIIDLYGDKQDDVGNRWFIGEPINVFFDYQFEGIWQEDEVEAASVYQRSPGQVKVKDINGDNQINAADREILGSSIPGWSGGITNNFSYKGFDLSVFINTRQKFLINSAIHGLDNLGGRYNIPTFVNYWTPENPSNAYPRPVSTLGGNNPNIDVLRYRDGSFVRVRNISLGYRFHEGLLSSIKLQSLRLYLSAQNPFTFTKYEGWDPESGNSYESYPSTKMFLIGLNASF